MNKFKKGDKIKALYNSGGYKIGEIYEVKSVDIDYPGQVKTVVDSNGYTDNGWSHYNFELVQENINKFKPGDKVRCIKMHQYYNDKLIIGEIYTVSLYGYKNYLRVKENNEKNSYEEDCFELVEENMKFKVGDTVRCNNTRYSYVEKDKEYVITEINNEGNLLFNHNLGYPYLANDFSLVSSKTTKLEELVKKANEGLDALNELNKYSDQIEVSASLKGKEFVPSLYSYSQIYDQCFRQGYTHLLYGSLRIKKKEFQTFEVGTGRWIVKLEGEDLHIGCQKFKAKELKVFLDEAMNGKTPQGQGFNCGKKGLYHIPTQNWLTWEEAENILKALVEYEV